MIGQFWPSLPWLLPITSSAGVQCFFKKQQQQVELHFATDLVCLETLYSSVGLFLFYFIFYPDDCVTCGWVGSHMNSAYRSSLFAHLKLHNG